ncbi:hypothetical protein JCM33374_g6489 [Metschnikowia sp. JCM 33374]|nr:hypothetical protein JCM33374_g6489 [Metschnikowia sp. JCM 33374]
MAETRYSPGDHPSKQSNQHNATVASPAICSPVSLGPRGFVGKVYAYQLNSMEGWDKGFFDCKYSLCPRIGGLSGVTELSFHLDQPDGRTIYNKVYNYRTSTTNYALDLKGFYRAPISGTYTFRVSGENGAQVQIGPGEICCDDTLADGTGDFYLR